MILHGNAWVWVNPIRLLTSWCKRTYFQRYYKTVESKWVIFLYFLYPHAQMTAWKFGLTTCSIYCTKFAWHGILLWNISFVFGRTLYKLNVFFLLKPLLQLRKDPFRNYASDCVGFIHFTVIDIETCQQNSASVHVFVVEPGVRPRKELFSVVSTSEI